MTTQPILLVLLCLLTFTTSAYAECAWVLWSRLDGKGRQTMLTPIVAFQSLAQCEAREAEMSKPMSDASKQTLQELGVTSLTYACLPDTIDPRGPKGGTR